MTPSPEQSSLSFRKALPWLCFLASVFFCNFISRVIFSPLMVAIEGDLGINHSQAGGFFFLISLGYSVMLLLSGLVSSRLPHRWCIVLSSFWMGLCLILLSQAESLWLTQALLLLFGMACGLYLPSGIASITSLIRPEDMGKAVSIHELAPNVSFVLAPLVADVILRFGTWRAGLAWLGGATIVLCLAFARFGRGGDQLGQAPNFQVLKDILGRKEFWVLAGLFFMGIGASFAPYSIMPLFLVDERGFSVESANRLLAVSRLLGPFGAIAVGFVVDWIGPKPTLAGYLVLVSIATACMGLLHDSWLVAAVIVQPFASVFFFTAGFAAMARIFPARLSSMAVSLIVPLGFFGGGGVVTAVLGVLGDHGGFALGFVLFGCLLALSMGLLPFLGLVRPIGE